MSRQYREAAEHVASNIYNHRLPATPEEFVDALEPIQEKCLKLLSCFSEQHSVESIFNYLDECSNLDASAIADRIYHLGFYEYYGLPSEEKPPITPEWTIVSIQNEAERYHRFFQTFQEATEFIVQIFLVDQFYSSQDSSNSIHQYQKKFEYQLAASWTAIQWHDLGGDISKCADIVVDIFRGEGLQRCKSVSDYIFRDILTIPQGIQLTQEYLAAFSEYPEQNHLRKATRWQWLLARLLSG